MSEPRYYSYRELPVGRNYSRAISDMIADQKKRGARFHRTTIINDEFPNEIYPHGLYCCGWDEEPETVPPFNWPMVAKG